MIAPKIINVSHDIGYIDFIWQYPAQAFSGYYLFQYHNKDKELIACIDKTETSYRYTITPYEQGAVITLGLCVYNQGNNTTSKETIIEIATYPSVPYGLHVLDASENKVEIAWDDLEPSRRQFTYSWSELPSLSAKIQKAKETMALPNSISGSLSGTTANVVFREQPLFELRKNNNLFVKMIPDTNDTFVIDNNRFKLRLAFGLQKSNRTIVIIRTKDDRSLEFTDVLPRQMSDRVFIKGDEICLKPIFDLEMIDIEGNQQNLGSLEIGLHGNIIYLNRNSFSPLPQDFFAGSNFSIDVIAENPFIFHLNLNFIITNPYIKHYQIERSNDGLQFTVINHVVEKQYTDIGNEYIDPKNGKHYFYRVSSVSWYDIASAPATIGVNVLKKSVIDARTLLSKTILNLPFGDYRIKAMGERSESGETPWIRIQTASYNDDTPSENMPNFRITTVTTKNEHSLPIVSRTIKTSFKSLPLHSGQAELINDSDALLNSDGGISQVEIPKFRIRIITTDGLESQAMLSQTIIMSPIKYIINKEKDYVRNQDNEKMVNKKGGL